MTEPRAPRESLTAMLQIRACGDESYETSLESFWGEALTEDLLARATLAAMAGVDTVPTATHASFRGPLPADLDLSLTREELAPSWIRVSVHHGAAPLADVRCRFGPRGEGLTYQSRASEPEIPAPEELPSEVELAKAEGWSQYATGPIESRRIGANSPVKDDEPAVWLGWLKPRERLPDDPHSHAAALAFVSGYRSHWAVERRLGADFPRTELTLQDHALWVHRAEHWDDWWLVRTQSDVGVGGRCFSRREIYTRDGDLVASAAWETVARSR